MKILELEKIRIGVVNYLNTRPMVYGIERSEYIQQNAICTGDFPANVARGLISGKFDMGLVPVAVIPKLPQYYIVSDYCIGADGEVASVGVFSECPLEELEEIYLDYQSRTSITLAQILFKNHWKKQVSFIPAEENFIENIKGKRGAVIIGDRALRQLNVSSYYYDLALAWRDYTGLPFVFAAWISTRKVSQEFTDEFNKANALGFQHLDEIVAKEDFSAYPLKEYYTKNVSYHLDERKKAALSRFLQEIEEFEGLLTQ
jgi:chorismate dehydratase